MPKPDTIFALIETHHAAMAKWNEAQEIGDKRDVWCAITCHTRDAVEETPCATLEGLAAKVAFLVVEVSGDFITADDVITALHRDLEHLVGFVDPIFAKLYAYNIARAAFNAEHERGELCMDPAASDAASEPLGEAVLDAHRSVVDSWPTTPAGLAAKDAFIAEDEFGLVRVQEIKLCAA